RGGLRGGASVGGGILVEDSAPLIRANVIEQNGACHGSGIALVYSMSRPAALVEDNEVIDNIGNGSVPQGLCDAGSWTTGGGVFISAPTGVDLGLVLSGDHVASNESIYGGGVWFQGGAGRIENCVVERNTSGMGLVG